MHESITHLPSETLESGESEFLRKLDPRLAFEVAIQDLEKYRTQTHWDGASRFVGFSIVPKTSGAPEVTISRYQIPLTEQGKLLLNVLEANCDELLTRWERSARLIADDATKPEEGNSFFDQTWPLGSKNKPAALQQAIRDLSGKLDYLRETLTSYLCETVVLIYHQAINIQITAPENMLTEQAIERAFQAFNQELDGFLADFEKRKG